MGNSSIDLATCGRGDGGPVAAYFFSRGLLSPPSFNVALSVVVVLTMLVPFGMRTRAVFLFLRMNREPFGKEFSSR